MCDTDEPLLIMRPKKWTQAENRNGVSKGGMIFIGVTDLSQIQQRPSPGLTLRKRTWGDAEAGRGKVIWKFEVEPIMLEVVRASDCYKAGK